MVVMMVMMVVLLMLCLQSRRLYTTTQGVGKGLQTTAPRSQSPDTSNAVLNGQGTVRKLQIIQTAPESPAMSSTGC